MTGYTQTFTLTFGDQAENHVGMQKIGEAAREGFTLEDLQQAQSWFQTRGIVCELTDLRTYADSGSELEQGSPYILVARNGLSVLLPEGRTVDEMFSEQDGLEKDTQAKMRGRVVNKTARWNLCFNEEAQEPDYAAGRGRIVAYESVPLLHHVLEQWPNVIGEKGYGLVVEGNYYYDLKKCGIGFHGDSERRKVIGVRLGATLPLRYQWFHRWVPLGRPCDLHLNHGDVYFMSEKATGRDWKSPSLYTLRHAAGAQKYLTWKPKK